MYPIVFKSKIYKDVLVINANYITVVNSFGDTYNGHLDENWKVVTKSRLGLGYLTRAMQEYKGQFYPNKEDINMKETVSSEYIKEIKANIKAINTALKQVSEAETAQENATCCHDYDNTKKDAQMANIDLMNAVEEIVRLASAMNSISGVTDTFTGHKVVEYSLK